MDQRLALRNELDAIITASRVFVKRLRNRNAHILAAQFTNIGMRSRKLKDRNDLLLPTFRRQVERMIAEFEFQVSVAYDKFPDLKKLPKRSQEALDGSQEPNTTLKVSITLPAHEWLFIDESIKNGASHSRSEYFRKLHMKKRITKR